MSDRVQKISAENVQPKKLQSLAGKMVQIRPGKIAKIGQKCCKSIQKFKPEPSELDHVGT